MSNSVESIMYLLPFILILAACIFAYKLKHKHRFIPGNSIFILAILLYLIPRLMHDIYGSSDELQAWGVVSCSVLLFGSIMTYICAFFNKDSRRYTQYRR